MLELVSVDGERMLVLAVGPTMYPQQRRILVAGNIRRRLHHECVHIGTVPALEANVVDGTQLQLGEKRVIVSSELAQGVAPGAVQWRPVSSQSSRCRWGRRDRSPVPGRGRKESARCQATTSGGPR